jgi:hypothetical protein
LFLFVFLGFVFVCFPDFPFLFPGVVAVHDQLSPSFSCASLGRPAPTAQSGILEKPPDAAWIRCCLSTPHSGTNLLEIQSYTRKPMTTASLPDHSNLGISSAPAVFDVLGSVARQSDWPSMINIDSSPISGRLSSPCRPPLRCRSRQTPESDQSVEWKT